MCSSLVSVHGLKNELYLCVVRLFRFIDQRTSLLVVCSALVLVHGLKNELHLCVARFFWFMD